MRTPVHISFAIALPTSTPPGLAVKCHNHLNLFHTTGSVLKDIMQKTSLMHVQSVGVGVQPALTVQNK